MNNKIIKGLFVFIIVIAFSCKKTEKVNSPVIPGVGYNSNYVDGSFSFMKMLNLYGDSMGKASQDSRCLFFTHPLHKDSIAFSFGKNVGVIHLNNIVLSKALPGFYFDSTYTDLNPPFKIDNSGSDTNFTAVNFSSIQTFPIFKGFADLPDTIHFQKNNIIKIKGYSNCTAIGLRLSNFAETVLTKNIPIGDSIINLPSLGLRFPDAYELELSFTFTTSKVWRIAGKNYLITNSYVYTQTELPANF